MRERPKALFTALSKGEPETVYCFIGTEIFLINKAIEEILNVIPECQRAFNRDIFHGSDSDLEEVLATARTLPFLAPRRVVVLRGLDRIRLTPGRGKLLSGYLEDPVPETVLILTLEDGKSAWLKKGDGRWKEVEFRPQRGPALRSAVREAAREKGVAMGEEAVTALIEEVGSDLGRIHQEMEKLSLSAGEKGVVDAAAVHLLVGGYNYQTMFELVDAIGRRDIPSSLLLFDRLLSSGLEVPALTGMLAKRFRILWHLAGHEGGGRAAGLPCPEVDAGRSQAAGCRLPPAGDRERSEEPRGDRRDGEVQTGDTAIPAGTTDIRPRGTALFQGLRSFTFGRHVMGST